MNYLLKLSVVALLLLLPACSSESKEEQLINGSWYIDVDKTIEKSEELKAEIKKNPVARELFVNLFKEFKIVIDIEKGVVNGKIGAETLGEEPFKILSAQGNKVVLKEVSNDAEMHITIIDQNCIEVTKTEQDLVLVSTRVT